MHARSEQWIELAKELGIKLPEAFLEIQADNMTGALAWEFLTADEARKLMAELDLRYNYPDREWRGIPFARSCVSEDIVCFDMKLPQGREALVLPIRDWHGPRWEFSGDMKTFEQWLAQDGQGYLS